MHNKTIKPSSSNLNVDALYKEKVMAVTLKPFKTSQADSVRIAAKMDKAEKSLAKHNMFVYGSTS